MVLEHEIPQGSKLYFGESARVKRTIENYASEVLSQNGFEEIITPQFAYMNHLGDQEEKKFLRLSNETNHIIVLRADTTVDLVRIISKRLGRSTSNQKWFYIQPVFTYPTNEIYQIGAEHIDNSDLSEFANMAVKIIGNTRLKPVLQISNMQIPIKVSKELGIDIELFKSGNIEAILQRKETWLHTLITLQKPEHLEPAIEQVPNVIKDELIKLKKLGESITYENMLYAPLYYAPMEYYQEMFFRIFEGNETLSMGGNYCVDGISNSGFAIYTDALIETIMGQK